MASAASAQSVTIPYVVDDEGMMVVQATVNGKTMNFTVDTGAGSTIVHESFPPQSHRVRTVLSYY